MLSKRDYQMYLTFVLKFNLEKLGLNYSRAKYLQIYKYEIANECEFQVEVFEKDIFFLNSFYSNYYYCKYRQNEKQELNL